MRLMLAHHPGEQGTTVRTLGVEERIALERHYRDGVEASWLRAWLSQAARLGLWLACDCRAAHELPPLLFVRADYAYSNYDLTAMTDRPPHQRHCPFHGPSARSTTADHGVAHSALHTLLVRWFSAARLNLRFPYVADDGVGTQYAALREVSRSLSLSAGQSLYDFSRTHPQGLPALCRTLCRAAPGRSTGVFLTVTAQLDPGVLREALQIDEACREWMDGADLPDVERPMGADVAGPYVVLFRLKGSAGRVGVERVLAQSVQSALVLVPIDRDYERRTLEVLLDVQRLMLIAHRRLITIRKTLADSLIRERGIAFQVQALGPNGRAQHGLDIVSVGSSAALLDAFDLEQPSDPMYHPVDPVQGPLSPSDQRFKRRLIAALLREAPRATERCNARHAAAVSR